MVGNCPHVIVQWERDLGCLCLYMSVEQASPVLVILVGMSKNEMKRLCLCAHICLTLSPEEIEEVRSV